jgi:polyvinyl alcohol dehydrogenase (cytochrome)
MYGPAGASIWSSPTIDVKGGLVYGTTGQSRTDVGTDGADAIVAFDLQTGARRWLMQAVANDNWMQGCEGPVAGPNCPAPLGPDADFGSPAILRTLPDGRRLLIGAQKSGMVHALDPDGAGKIVWRKNLAKDAIVPAGMTLRDRAQPGVVFGMAADQQKLYVAIADPGKSSGHVPLGIYALKLSSGETVWHTSGASVPSCSWGSEGCTGAQRTAVTLIPGVAFAGSANGHMRAYETGDGKVIWDVDTAQVYAAVNGVKAQGGSVEGAATVVAGSTLYVMSGYGSYGGGLGNALIAFTVDGK